MIYLKVRGGLCNRIRAIDSIISLCQLYHKNLTVIWPLDNSLNTNFQSLFEEPILNNITLNIINCPDGFPEKYFPTPLKQVKNLIKGRFLKREIKNISNKIYGLPKNRFLSEIFLDDQYNYVLKSNKGSVSEIDKIFYKTLQNVVNDFFNENNCLGYINSCYRLSIEQNNYKYFSPVRELQTKISKTTSKYTNTYGLHIRRSDHQASKEHSTLEKFTVIIENKLKKNPLSTFFLSTDDEPTKSRLIALYGDRIIYNQIESYDRNSPKAIKDAVIDLFCLAKTKALYGSHHSSFSQVAAVIGNISEITAK